MEERYSETHHTWNKITQHYEDKFMDLDLYDGTYKRFCDLLRNASASVLEIGCGPGNITRQLLAINSTLNIVATDVAENMVALAKKNNPSVEAMVLDGRHVHKINRKFDGIVCGFIIPYLSKIDLSSFIANCSNTLHEKGVLYLSYVEGDYDDSGFFSASTGDRSYFHFYGFNELKHLLDLHNLVIEDKNQVEYKKADNTVETHTIIIAVKS